jgi:hypothetical protein
VIPRPRVSKPDRRQEIQRSRLWSMISHTDLDQNVFDIGFGVFDTSK